MYYISISNGLIEDKHYKKMGAAVWQFMWCIDKITKIDDDGTGYVWGGKPVQLKDITVGSRITNSRNLQKLQKYGYIELKHTPYGIIIKVFQAKKRFNKIDKPNSKYRFIKSDKPRNESDKPRNESDKPRNESDKPSTDNTHDNTHDYYKAGGSEQKKNIEKLFEYGNIKKLTSEFNCSTNQVKSDINNMLEKDIIIGNPKGYLRGTLEKKYGRRNEEYEL